MNNNLKSDSMDDLFSAILSLNTIENCYDFFDDLCTIQELRAFAQRFQVARMLSNGMVFNDIVKMTGASTATISRVNRSLNYGSGGYQSVISGLEE